MLVSRACHGEFAAFLGENCPELLALVKKMVYTDVVYNSPFIC